MAEWYPPYVVEALVYERDQARRTTKRLLRALRRAGVSADECRKVEKIVAKWPKEKR